MEKKSQEINIDEKKKDGKIGFLKKLKYSILKIEKYPELASLGITTALRYLFIILSVLAIIISLGTVYQMHEQIYQIAEDLKEFPEFTYSEGILKVNSEEVIIKDTNLGKIIVDINQNAEEKVQQYTNDIKQVGRGFIILEDKLFMISSNSETIEYKYVQLFDTIGMTEFTKDSAISYITSNEMNSFYLKYFMFMFIYALAVYFIDNFTNIIIVCAVGKITSLLIKIKMRFVAIFNMAVYATTLSILLNIIYVIINIFTNFNIQYFNVMYIAITTIYVISAIMLLKSDEDKRQQEIGKIVEVQKQVKREMEEQSENKENKNEEKEKKKNKKNKEDSKDEGTPEGSNA